MKIKTVAMAGVLSLAGLGLIGAGAHAQFDTATNSSQQITTGAPDVVLSGSCYGVTCVQDANYSLSPDGLTLTFAPGGPYGSSFTTGDEMVTATNEGSLNLTEEDLTLSSTYPGSALYDEASICIGSTGLGTGGSFFELYNGPISAAGGLGLTGSYTWGQNGDVLTAAGSTPNGAVYPAVAKGPTDNYIVNVYAGPGQETACGTSGPSTPTLQNDAENESIAISVQMTFQG